MRSPLLEQNKTQTQLSSSNVLLGSQCGHTKMDIRLLEVSGLDISDSMRRSAVKVTPVKMKADLNSSDQDMYLIMQ